MSDVFGVDLVKIGGSGGKKWRWSEFCGHLAYWISSSVIVIGVRQFIAGIQ